MKNAIATFAPADANWKPQLAACLQELHLPAIRRGWEDAAHTAEQETLSYGQFLLEVTSKECQARRNNRIDRLRRESGLPLEKTLQNFDLKRLPESNTANESLAGRGLSRRTFWCSVDRAPARRTYCAASPTN